MKRMESATRQTDSSEKGRPASPGTKLNYEIENKIEDLWMMIRLDSRPGLVNAFRERNIVFFHSCEFLLVLRNGLSCDRLRCGKFPNPKLIFKRALKTNEINYTLNSFTI